MDEWAATARLVRRTGFGASGTQVDAVRAQGGSRFVEQLLAADPTRDPGALRTPAPQFATVAQVGRDADAATRKAHNQRLHEQSRQLTAWWLRRMAAVEQPFGEKLTFLWHAHFATSLQKVRHAAWMAQQNERLRTLGRGGFRTLALTMLTDAATLQWLDGERNTARGPNENLSREFMEIFALGHGDGYTETDVRQGARALTGWKIQPDGSTVLRPRLHDSGSKTFLGVTGDLDATGYCDAVLARPASAPFVLGRLWALLVSDTPPPAPLLTRLVNAYGAGRDLGSALRAMLTDPAFAAAQNTLVTGPVDWLLGVVRTLHVPLTDDAQAMPLVHALDALGQLPLFPPSVGGWPSGPVWLSTAAADLRFRTAQQLLRRAELPTLTGSTTARLETLAHALGVAAWSDSSLAALKGSAASTRHLVAVAVNTPEYLIH